MPWILVAVMLGLLVGASLGALGGGGSTLAVPVLVFVAGMTAQEATSASLLVVGTAAVIGAARHWRLGNVRLGAGLAFGAAGIVGSRLGTTVNQSLDEQVLLLVFSALIVFVAVRMYRSAAEPCAADPRAAGERAAPTDHRGEGVRAAHPGGPVATLAPPRRGVTFDLAALTRLAVAATGVGLLTGLFGVGGGFVVVPALTLLLGYGAREAIGTSLVVIAVNATIALALRAGDVSFDWSIVAPFLATVTAGVLVGARIAAGLDARRLTRAFAVMLGVVAVTTALGALAA